MTARKYSETKLTNDQRDWQERGQQEKQKKNERLSHPRKELCFHCFETSSNRKEVFISAVREIIVRSNQFGTVPGARAVGAIRSASASRSLAPRTRERKPEWNDPRKCRTQMRKLFIRVRQQQWSRARCRLSRTVALSSKKVRRVLRSCMVQGIETRQRFVSAARHAAPAPRRPLSLTSATVTRKRDVNQIFTYNADLYRKIYMPEGCVSGLAPSTWTRCCNGA
jgi:hypothetical protein